MADTRKESSSYSSQKKTAASLSLLEKLDTIPALLTVFANVITAVFTGAIRSKERKPASFYKYVMLTALRTMTRRTSVRQQHYLAPPTDDAYVVACKNRRVLPKSEVLEDGTRAHWIGSRDAENIVINFHGGGYVFPAGPEMFEYMFQVVDVLNKQHKNAACLFLSYDLAPGAVYPRQLQQASALIDHVVNKLSIPPSKIILTGDSAGANLVMATLSHLSHPHPSTTTKIPPVKISEPIRGAVLISPWISFDLTAKSFTTNEYKDCICTDAGKQWSSAFMNSPWPHKSNSDYYNQACTAPESWWNDFPVQEVLIVAGEDEVLVDGIVSFEKTFSKGFGKEKVELVVCKGYHDEPNLDLQLGYKEKDEGEQAKLIKSWISSKL